MSYDRAALASVVIARLRERPQTTLVALSKELNIDRHTIDRALVEHTGLAFRQLKESFTNEAIRSILSDGQIKSIKQAAAEAGYGSAGSFARRTRRTLGMAPAELRRGRRR